MIPYSRLWLASAALALSGCASFDIGQSIDRTNQATAGFTQGKLRLALDQKQKTTMESAATALLNQPLSQADAVHLALLNSPAIQAMLAQHWADAASAAQSGRIANPVFAFERSRLIDEVEIGRMLSFGLLDLLTLPQRQAMAGQRIEMAQLQIAMDVIDQVTQVRQAWVRAVAAQQSLQYARQVSDAAEAGAELAARMQKAGNFSKLQKERQQAFYADAMAQAVAAEYAASSAREALIRLLGLSDAQVQSLKLPEHFPDLPTVPRSAEEIATMANKDRLDIRLAQAEFEASARAQGLKQITSLTDIELGVRRNTVFDNASGSSAIKRGVEISLKLPVFDWGSMQRDSMNARTLAAANRLEASVRAAGANLRDAYAAYRTSYEISRHYRDAILPLRKRISDENLLRYNGMLIGVFELLADTREQIASVTAAIDAEKQFWLADAGLQAAVTGRPMATMSSFTAGMNAGSATDAAAH